VKTSQYLEGTPKCHNLHNDKLGGLNYWADEVFEFQVPKTCEGVPDKLLNPAESWPSKETYMQKYRQLALRFADNFNKYETNCPPEIAHAGPKVKIKPESRASIMRV
jgi:phosphoenolpyruvate carboxykinase (ATP)